MSEIRIISFNFAPRGWALCNGQFLPINQNQALFSLLGTNYGGNGQTTFALPDMRGRVPIGAGQHPVGERAGQEFHTLVMSEMPAHTHGLAVATTSGTQISGAGAYLAAETLFSSSGATTTLPPSLVSSIGGSQPHENRQPSVVLNYIIALQGVFPSQN